MSYTIIPERDYDIDIDHDSASDVSGISINASSIGDTDRYLSEGVEKLRDLADSGCITDDEEQRRKELIEQFFEYHQRGLRDLGDDELLTRSYFLRIFWSCWKGLANMLGFTPR